MPMIAHLLVLPLLVGPGPLPVVPLPQAATPGLRSADETYLTDAEWPLEPAPRVVNGFSPPVEEWGAGHRGVDLAGHVGQPVRAARDGTVTFAGMIAGRGVVVVSHGATRTTYEPVSARVRVGDEVGAGERVGTLQLFGSHCWPAACLHWGLIQGETYRDPLDLVGAGPVRLLPLFTDLPSPQPSQPDARSLRFVRPAGAPVGMPAGAGRW